LHIISAEQFDTNQLRKIFDKADSFKRQAASLSGKKRLGRLHSGRQMASLFYQPSTRTRISFEAAAAKMGMGVVSTENALEHSSSAKGETIEDTIRILDGYDFDAIVMRHHQAGAAARAAKVSRTPIINAGDGTGEHPTQAVLDAYTILASHGKLQGLNIVIGGDLRYGRTVRSLAQLLSKYPKNKLVFVSVPELQVNPDVKAFLKKRGTDFQETSDVKAALADADVVYWTRLQKEYLKNPKAVAQKFKLGPKLVGTMKKSAIIMHPLPRVDELDEAIDNDSRAAYFRQASNGLYVRMAIIDHVLGAANA
jgi:aspartate carbamoyltransferase catalytic subunit